MAIHFKHIYMTKLSNGVEYNNPKFPAAFAEYLICNRFKAVSNKTELRFVKANVTIIILHDNIDIFFYDPIAMAHVWGSSFMGFGSLDINGWILLMHATKVQNIQFFEQNARTLSEQLGVEAKLVHQALMTTLKNLQPVERQLVHQ